MYALSYNSFVSRIYVFKTRSDAEAAKRMMQRHFQRLTVVRISGYSKKRLVKQP